MEYLPIDGSLWTLQTLLGSVYVTLSTDGLKDSFIHLISRIAGRDTGSVQTSLFIELYIYN